MSLDIRKYNPLITQDENRYYIPIFTVIKRKIYEVKSWQELFKILLFSLCYNNNNMEQVIDDKNINIHAFNDKIIISDMVEESECFVKFSPELYIHTFNNTRYNCALLNKVKQYCNTKDFIVYIIRADSLEEAESSYSSVPQFIEDFRIKNNYKSGSTKHLVAHINGKVLSKREKFLRRIEREFDQRVFIGDIDLLDDELILKEFMHEAIQKVVSGRILFHEKVFAYGLVQTALNHYKDKVYWPHIDKDYAVHLKTTDQHKINKAFEDIMKKNNKAYEENCANIQNICMHAFICNKCAGQFFDYMFEFWRVDLDCSLENIIDDDKNDLFEILIDEIDNNVQDVMIHTTMALRNNASGCKNRFRRILKMIDDSFWKGIQYSNSRNRITKLFTEWKNDPHGNFIKEQKRRSEDRKRGRGEKRLSKPTIVYNTKYSTFSLLLPKQILKDYTENEHLYWYVKIGEKSFCIKPDTLRGKSSYFTKEASHTLAEKQLFEEYHIMLKSEVKDYCNYIIPNEQFRFFNGRNRCTEIIGGYISKETRYLITQKDVAIDYINGVFTGEDNSDAEFDIKYMEPSDGEILILPDGQAVPIGKPLNEGIIEKYTITGAKAVLENVEYPVISKSEKMFIKTTKAQFKGTALRFYNNNKLARTIKVSDNKYLEFRLDDSIKDVYGYIIDLHEFVSEDGFYDIELTIPKRKPVTHKFCLISGFSYTFQNSPYVFSEYGRIEFPSNLGMVTNEYWVKTHDKNSFVFPFDEEVKTGNEYVKDRKLRLLYKLGDEQIIIVFDIPTLYWRYDDKDDWSFRHPDDMFKNKMPSKIYLTGCLDYSSSKLNVSDGFSDGHIDISANKDSKLGLYYYRTIDIMSLLSRDEEYQNIDIIINGARYNFLKVYCRSKVRSSSISGDIKKQIIYGYFDILGASDYMVTIKKDEEVIAEDIPIIDGEFSVECSVTEGRYDVTLYELEEDDSGFDSISYELQKLTLDLVDVGNFSGKTLKIDYIRDRARKYSPLDLSKKYLITNMRKIDYKSLSSSVDVTNFWKNDELCEDFTYYFGDFCVVNYYQQLKILSKALIVFDDPQNAGEILINVIHDDVGCSLYYNKDKRKLIPYEIKDLKLTVLDDDLYSIGVSVRR